MRHARNLFFTIVSAALLTLLLPTPAQAVPTAWDSSVVYVENHARSYPVKRVAENMDNGSSLDLRVVKRCPANRPCIKVTTRANFPGNQFTESRWGVRDGRTAFVTIILDRSWERKVSAKKERITFCHELALALGLSHTGRRTKSCTSMNMRGKDKISKAERRQLNRLY